MSCCIHTHVDQVNRRNFGRRCHCLSHRFPFKRLDAFLLLVSCVPLMQASEEDKTLDEEAEESPAAHAVLFPTFSLTIGVLVFYLLTRYARALPYTAVMFFLGTLMGIGAELLDHKSDQLNESIRMWIPIDSEILLLVFLPGLVFKDAYGQNVHLFRVGLNQCLIFAFPLVLAGTALTALVAYYIFPYNWSFNLAMTFGSILSATDPVAVAALLDAVSAPPRLKVHIAGESLLNDGAAIVFFSIFVERYLFDLNVGIGENVDLARGVAIFCQKALGGVAAGIFFGLGLLLILFLLDRRFNREENVVEVTASFAIAYLGFYVAEPVWKTSGVISTVATGVLVKYFGRAMVNNPRLLDDFWTLVEHLLNTVLFVLGGTVWGAVIASGEQDGLIGGRDWGYLFLLYFLLHLIRLFLFTVAYPITSRIGLKTCWHETMFQVYGGLRGAVGIALALFLDNEVGIHTDPGSEPQDETGTLFFFVGGIAFLTLTVNGTTAGMALTKLGLTHSSESRIKIVRAYRTRYRASAIDNMVHLLTQERFRQVNFALVRYHVPVLADLTQRQLMEAVERHRETTLPEDYHAPYLGEIMPYLERGEEQAAGSTAVGDLEAHDTLSDLVSVERKLQRELRVKNRRRQKRRSSSIIFHMLTGEPLSSQELRLLFISILKAAYDEQIRNGELEDRTFLSIALEQSLFFAENAVSRGEPLQDWDFVTMVDAPVNRLANKYKNNRTVLLCLEKVWATNRADIKVTAKRLKIERSMAFMAAHREARDFFRKEFQDCDRDMSEAGKIVISESQSQYRRAEAVLHQYEPHVIQIVASHKFCTILLNLGVQYVSKLVSTGLLKDVEAEHWVEEIEGHIAGVLSCNMSDHPGELSLGKEEKNDIAQEDDDVNRLAWQHISVGSIGGGSALPAKEARVG